MNYRKFGNTGEKISALGFGCMRFPEYEKDGKMYVDQDKVDEMVAEARKISAICRELTILILHQNIAIVIVRKLSEEQLRASVIRYCYQRKFR